MTRPEAVFFISFGGPEKREDIRPFLEIVTRGRRIPPERIEEVVHHYERIGGASPINAIASRQAEALQKALAKTDRPLPVYLGNRNWHPFIEDTLHRMATEGIERAVGFITAAHRCEASHERYIGAVEEARKEVGPSAPIIDYVGPWFDHPLFMEAIAARVHAAIPENPIRLPWIFTAHSIPCAMADQSNYVPELKKTAELVCRRFGKTDGSLAYTSRSGPHTEAWLEPDIGEAIRAHAEKGVHEILLIPIGFVADHVEVLYDLDVEAKEMADDLGVHLYRAQTVGDHPLFIQMMVEVVHAASACRFTLQK